MRTRLTADWVVGHENGRHCLIRQGEVISEDKHIIFVGHDFPGEVHITYACGKALIAPGFIDLDALADLDTTILGFDNQPGWRKGRVWPQSYMDRGPYEMYTQEELRHPVWTLPRNRRRSRGATQPGWGDHRTRTLYASAQCIAAHQRAI